MILLTTTCYDKKFWTPLSYAYLVFLRDDYSLASVLRIPTPASLSPTIKPGLRGISVVPWEEKVYAVCTWNRIYLVNVSQFKIVECLSHPAMYDLHGLVSTKDGFWVTAAGKGLFMFDRSGALKHKVMVDGQAFSDFHDSRYVGKSTQGKYPNSFSYVFSDDNGNIYLSVQKKDDAVDSTKAFEGDGGIYQYNMSKGEMDPVFVGTSWVHDGLRVGDNFYFHDSKKGLFKINPKEKKQQIVSPLGAEYFYRGLCHNPVTNEILSFGTEKESMKNKYGFQRVAGRFQPQMAVLDEDLNLVRVVDLSWMYKLLDRCSDIRFFSAAHMIDPIFERPEKHFKDRMYALSYSCLSPLIFFGAKCIRGAKKIAVTFKKNQG
tara:strand:- start:1323 stop:2447 length:1125 start_codon:yes stop_codon:yes gene_type:complete